MRNAAWIGEARQAWSGGLGAYRPGVGVLAWQARLDSAGCGVVVFWHDLAGLVWAARHVTASPVKVFRGWSWQARSVKARFGPSRQGVAGKGTAGKEKKHVTPQAVGG